MGGLLLQFAPFLVIGVMALGGWGLWEQHKVDQDKIASQSAQLIADQQQRVEDAKNLAMANTRLETLSVRSQPIIQTVLAAPATSGCGPAVDTAVSGLRDLRAARDTASGPGAAKPGAVPATGATAARPQAK
jgi:hypothetical protein